MKYTLHCAWVELLIAGLSSLLFGITVLAFHSIPLLTLIWIFAAYMIIKGLSLSIGSWKTKRKESYWSFLFWYGILNVMTGVVTSQYPGITILILGFIVSVNLLLSGLLQIIMAFHLYKEVRGVGWLIISGSTTLIAGMYIYIIPRVSQTTILSLIAVASTLLSIFMISLSLSAKNWHGDSAEKAVQI